MAAVPLVMGALVAASSPASAATVTKVVGNAYGFYTNFSLFGGPYDTRGPEPQVTLASDASNSPQDAHVDSGNAQYGPAAVVQSGPIDVHVEGSLGDGGSVAASSDVHGAAPDDQVDPLHYDEIQASCSADDTGAVSSTVTITNGTVTSEPDPNNPDNITSTAVPVHPSAGYTMSGKVPTVLDGYNIVFNEQANNADGSVTVTAAHIISLGPNGKGDAYIGQVICGLSSSAAAPTTTITTTTLPAGNVGTPYDATLQATGGSTPYAWSVAGGSLPAGLSLNPNTGDITGTPSAVGTTNFTVGVSAASGGTDTHQLSIAVGSPQAPVIGIIALPNGTVGAPYAETIPVTRGTGPYTWSIATGRLPAGLGLDTSSGEITGRPSTAETASFTVAVRAASGGSGTQDLSITTMPPPGPTALTAGLFNSCGLRGDGAIACWGQNGGYPTDGPFTQVQALYNGNCDLRTDHTIGCYGFAAPPAGTFNQLGEGVYNACAIRTDATLTCFGSDYLGASEPPAGTFAQVSGANYTQCGVRTDGTLACWGADDSGQAEPPAGTFTQVSVGGPSACAVRADGTLACWGSDYFGESEPPAGTFTEVATGSLYACAIRTDGTITCWGIDSLGQTNAPSGTFLQLSSGGYHTCAIRTNGAWVCWDQQWDAFGQTDPPTVTIGATTDTPDSSYHGQSVTYATTIVSTTAGGPAPTGCVTFSALAGTSSTELGQDCDLSNGVQVSHAGLAPGVYGIAVHYSGDANYVDFTQTMATHTVVPAGDLSVSVSASPSAQRGNGPATYTVTVTNDGPDAAQGVRLANVLPSTQVDPQTGQSVEAYFISGSSTQGSCGFPPPPRSRPSSGEAVDCALGTVPAGQSVHITIMMVMRSHGHVARMSHVYQFADTATISSDTSQGANVAADSASATVSYGTS